MSGIWDNLINFSGYSESIDLIWRDVGTIPVTVTAGRSRFNRTEGLQINQNEALASYFSRLFPSNLDVQLTHCTDDNNNYPYSSIMVQDSAGHLESSFRQTLRVPDDGTVHQLPPSLGPFPLFNVEKYRHKLPPELTMTGGLFLPMYRTYCCHR
jgi:hypothetical protein